MRFSMSFIVCVGLAVFLSTSMFPHHNKCFYSVSAFVSLSFVFDGKTHRLFCLFQSGSIQVVCVRMWLANWINNIYDEGRLLKAKEFETRELSSNLWIFFISSSHESCSYLGRCEYKFLWIWDACHSLSDKANWKQCIVDVQWIWLLAIKKGMPNLLFIKGIKFFCHMKTNSIESNPIQYHLKTTNIIGQMVKISPFFWIDIDWLSLLVVIWFSRLILQCKQNMLTKCL